MLKKWGFTKLALVAEFITIVVIFTIIGIIIVLNLVALGEMLGRAEIRVMEQGQVSSSSKFRLPYY